MSNLSVNTITDASGGSTASVNGYTPQASNMAGTNAIINGNMAIWQRGTSFTAGGYTADRFNRTGGSVATVSQQTHALGDNPIVGDSSPYFMRLTQTSDGLNTEIKHLVEDVRSFAGTTVTVSFWAKTNNGTESFNFKLYQNFGTGGSPSALTSACDTSVYTPTTSWQRYSFVCDIPSIAGKTIGTDNNSFIWVRLAQIRTSNVGFSLDITGVQLEAGSSTASPFAYENYGDTLRKCERFYQKVPPLVGHGNSTNFWGAVAFRTEMRAQPAISLPSNSLNWTDGYASDYPSTNANPSWTDYSAHSGGRFGTANHTAVSADARRGTMLLQTATTLNCDAEL
jgi:hypothetical protein